MKFTSLLAATGLLAIGVSAQKQFDLSALNGTWNLNALPRDLYAGIRIVSHFLDVNVTCPQIYIRGNSSEASYIQPSALFSWYNSTTNKVDSFNFTLTGLLSLDKGSNATDGNFTVALSLPVHNNITSNKHLKMLAAATGLTAINYNDPLPGGPDLYGNFSVKLISTQNNTLYDGVFINAWNFTNAHNTTAKYNATSYNTDDDYVEEDYVTQVPLFFGNETLKLNNATFHSVVSANKYQNANLTLIKNRCVKKNNSRR